MLTVSVIMLTLGQSEEEVQGQPAKNSIINGIVPVLTGSILSGIATTVSQKVLQNDNKNSYLYTSELGVWGILTLIVYIIFNDKNIIIEHGIFKGWTIMTFIPVFSNALGGVFVGLVVKYAGGVRKGFGTVAGMFLTAVLSFFIEYTPFSVTTWVALPLLIASVYIHTSYPYRPPTDLKKVSIDPPPQVPNENTPENEENRH